jgi:hypothetical protein
LTRPTSSLVIGFKSYSQYYNYITYNWLLVHHDTLSYHVMIRNSMVRAWKKRINKQGRAFMREILQINI